MNEFEFSLTKDDTFNHLYEYIISHSYEFFGISNNGVTYSTIIDNRNFTMLVYLDEDKIFTDSFDTDNLAFTDDSYRKIQVKPAQQDVISIYNGHIGLRKGEIRYVKFNWERILNETGMMFYSMVNACLKIECHEAIMSYDSTNDMFSYKGSYNKRKHSKKERTIVDLSEQMKKCWY